MRTLILPIVKVRTFILPIILRVRTFILALSKVSEPSYCHCIDKWLDILHDPVQLPDSENKPTCFEEPRIFHVKNLQNRLSWFMKPLPSVLRIYKKILENGRNFNLGSALEIHN